MRPQSVAAAAVATLISTPGLAGAIGESFSDFGTCYARHYDDAHLRKNPRQRVTAIMLSHTATGEDTRDWDAVLEFGFTLRDGETYSAVAYCRADQCALEGDGGQFEVTTTRDGGLRLSVLHDFLGLEGENGWSGNLADSDDKVFLVYRARPAACDFS